MKTLTHIEAEGTYLRLDGQRLYCGLYLNEVLTRVLPEGDECHQIFSSYEHTLSELAEQMMVEPVLRRWEQDLLHLLGVAPDLRCDVSSGEPVQANSHYRLWNNEGFVMAEADTKGSFLGSSLLAMAIGDYSDEATLRSAKLINRLLLGNILGTRPLKSRELFSTLSKGKPQ